jgi:hypothetical protein
MVDDSPPPPIAWPSVAHSRHATPAPDFAHLPVHFTPTTDMPPFTARLGGNVEDDGPAPSDRTPSLKPDPELVSNIIANQVRHEIDFRLNPIMKQLNTLMDLMQRLTDKVFDTAPASPAAPPKAVPATARIASQNPTPPNPPVATELPAPWAPETHSQGVSEVRIVPAHTPVTNATLEAPLPISPTIAADAVEFPSLEETRLAIPSRRVKRNAENKAAKDRQWRQVPGATGPLPTTAPTTDHTRVDDDDGHIPLWTSRVRPLFASIATQRMVALHQQATHTGNQARAVQGRSKAGHKLPLANSEEQSVTHVTVIHHGGLPDTEAERALHAKPTHFLVQAAQRALDRLSRTSPCILHSHRITTKCQFFLRPCR